MVAQIIIRREPDLPLELGGDSSLPDLYFAVSHVFPPDGYTAVAGGFRVTGDNSLNPAHIATCRPRVYLPPGAPQQKQNFLTAWVTQVYTDQPGTLSCWTTFAKISLVDLTGLLA